MKATYRDVEIEARPQMTDLGWWRLGGLLREHDGEGVTTRRFSGRDICRTREEAVRRCLDLGRQIIDGRA